MEAINPVQCAKGADPKNVIMVFVYRSDETSGNISAAKTDVTKLQADLKVEDNPTSSSTQTASPLNTLVSQISASLSSGSVQGALHDLATYLVQNGQATGGLIDTTA